MDPGEWVSALIGLAGVAVGVGAIVASRWRGLLVMAAAGLVVFAVAVALGVGAGGKTPDSTDVVVTPTPTATARTEGGGPQTGQDGTEQERPSADERRARNRLIYAQRLRPACIRWRAAVAAVSPTDVRTATPSEFVRTYAAYGRMVGQLAGQMRSIPAPPGDEPALARIIAAFERLGASYADMADSRRLNQMDSAMQAAQQAEAYIAKYNGLAEDFGFDASCLI